jgi:pimeloyl-ACP methyl ester carboxylesterase
VADVLVWLKANQTSKSLPIRQFLLSNLHRPRGSDFLKSRVPLNVLYSALEHLGDFPYKDPKLIRYEKPALFIRGTQSSYVPDEVLPLIGEFFPLFRMVDIMAGHWVISEQPEAFRQGSFPFPLLLLFTFGPNTQ